MLLYLLRHGETEWNRQRLLQGRSDVELNENGRRLARETARGLRDVPFDLAIASPLKRAWETAELVLQGREIPLVEDSRLVELSFGESEGKPWRKSDTFPGDPNIYNLFNAPGRYVAPAGGETLLQLAQRTADFMHDICSRPELEEKTILVATHGAAMRGLLNSLKWNFSPSFCQESENNKTYAAPDLSDFWGDGVAPNCGVAIIESHQGHPVLLEQNKTYYTVTEVRRYD